MELYNIKHLYTQKKGKEAYADEIRLNTFGHMTTLIIIAALIVLIVCLHKLERIDEERQFILHIIESGNLTAKAKGEFEKRLAKLG